MHGHHAMASSLPVERRHSEVKKWEASKLTHIAAASRNAIAMRFLRWREEQCLKVDAKQKELRRSVRSNLQSLAWKHASANRPAGLKRSGSEVGQPQAAADVAAGKAMSGYIAENRTALEGQKTNMVILADEELKRLLASFPILVTRPQWAQWLSENIGEFRERMRTAPALRRQGNVRLCARPGLPAPSRRIQPLLEKRSYNSEWVKRLANRTGWWGVRTQDNGDVILFLMLLRGRTYYLELGNRAATGAPTCTLDSSFLFRTCVHELPQLEVMLAGDEVLKVWEFKVQGEAVPGGGVNMSVCQARTVTEYAEWPRRQRQEETDNEGDSSSDAELVDNILPVVDTDDEKSGGSLDSSSSSTSDDEDPYIIAKPLRPDLAATGAEESAASAATGAPKVDVKSTSPCGKTLTSPCGAIQRATL